jgi:two-component system sensor histidine kinase BaeS
MRLRARLAVGAAIATLLVLVACAAATEFFLRRVRASDFESFIREIAGHESALCRRDPLRWAKQRGPEAFHSHSPPGGGSVFIGSVGSGGVMLSSPPEFSLGLPGDDLDLPEPPSTQGPHTQGPRRLSIRAPSPGLGPVTAGVPAMGAGVAGPPIWLAYDEHGKPSTPDTPPLEGALRSVLARADVAMRPVLLPQGDVGATEVAVRTAGTGPCTILVSRHPNFDGAPFARRMLPLAAISLLVSLIVLLVVLITTAPVVRRIVTLSEGVHRAAGDQYRTSIEPTGSDEIADLGAAFNQASAKIREYVASVEAREVALRKYLANTAHDVMVPLTVMQGYLADLQAGLQPQGAVRRAFSSLVGEVEYVGALIRNLAVAARLESGAFTLQREAFQLDAVLERAILRIRVLARELDVAVDFAVPAANVMVNGDATLIEQALSNLLHNAVRYSDRGGHVAAVLDMTREGGFQLRVLDDGPGIPPEQQQSILERGVRGSAAARYPAGMGLGLTIANEVITLHGWELCLGAEPGGGFRVEIRGHLATAEDGLRALS